MEHSPLLLRRPPTCRNCGAPSTVTVQTSIRANTVVVVEWCCIRCDVTWTIPPDAFVERRHRPTDRRRSSRTDRRKR